MQTRRNKACAAQRKRRIMQETPRVAYKAGAAYGIGRVCVIHVCDIDMHICEEYSFVMSIIFFNSPRDNVHGVFCRAISSLEGP